MEYGIEEEQRRCIGPDYAQSNGEYPGYSERIRAEYYQQDDEYGCDRQYSDRVELVDRLIGKVESGRGRTSHQYRVLSQRGVGTLKTPDRVPYLSDRIKRSLSEWLVSK